MGDFMKGLLVFLLIGMCVAAFVVIGYKLGKEESTNVDNIVAAIITSADAELERADEHRATTYERVEVIRYETSRKVFALDPDELVAHALQRAENFRSRVAASGDIKDTAGVVIF